MANPANTNNDVSQDSVPQEAGSEAPVLAVIVDKPEANQSEEVQLQPGEQYIFSFERADIQSFAQQGDDLTITFKDNSSITLKDYVSAINNDTPAEISFVDSILEQEFADLFQSPGEEELEDPQAELRDSEEGEEQADAATDEQAEEVAQTEPAAGESAEELAEIEPAAGEEAGGAEGRGGFGFQSSFDAQGVIPVDAVGPINPTLLQYGVEFPSDELLAFDDPGPLAVDFNPIISGPIVNNVDESNFDTGPLVDGGTVDVDFGGDGPGVICATGDFDASGSMTGGTLTVDGFPVQVTSTPEGYVGTITVGMTASVPPTPITLTVFTLTIDTETGDYVYTQYMPFEHADGTDPNDVITLTFGVKAEDSDGDTTTTTITVNVSDDGPEINSDSQSVDESDLGPVTVNGDLDPDFGGDGSGQVCSNGDFDASGSVAGGTLTSNGVEVVVTQTADGYVGMAGGETIFTLTIDPLTGEYEFTLIGSLDHADPDDPNDVITLEFGVKIIDSDGDTDTATITIDVADDAPVINDDPDVGNGLENVDETDLGPVVVGGKLDVDAGGDTPVDVGANGNFDASGSMTGGTLTSGGVDVVVTQTADGYVGMAGGETIFTLTINADGEYEFTLLGPLDHADGTDPNDVITLEFGVTATDADGDSDDGVITINVADDGPSVGDDSQSVDETDLGPITVNGDVGADFGSDGGGEVSANGDFDASGSMTGGTLTSGGVDVVVTQTADGYVGMAGGETIFTLTVNDDGTYEFTLLGPLDHADGTDPNDVITLEFGVDITDFDGDTDSGTITINIVDDAPVINDDPDIGNGFEVVDETDLGPVTVDGTLDVDIGGDTPGTISVNGNFDASGSMTGGTLTSNGVEVIVVETAAGYVGTAGGETIFTLTVDPDTGEYSFTLHGTLDHADVNDHDDVITLEFGVTATDSDGDSDDGNITINIHDDGPVANDDSVTFDQDDVSTTGNVLDNDNLSNDGTNLVTQVSFEGTDFDIPAGGTITVDGEYGTLEISSDGSYTYTLYPGVGEPTTVSADPSAGDVAGTQTSITLNGITISTPNGLDLTWVDTADGSGIGIDGPGNDSPKIWPKGETLDLSFEQDASQVTIAVSDIGDNNDDGNHAIEYVVTLADGTVVTGEMQITADQVQNGVFEFDLNSADFGGQLITSVSIFSVDDGDYQGASFLLDNIEVTYPGEDCPHDEFEYTVTDGDGDTDTAVLDIQGKDEDDIPEVSDEELKVDETNLGPVTLNGELDADFGGDGPGVFHGNGDFSFSGSATGGTLTSGGVDVVVTQTLDGYVGTAGGETIFTLKIDSNGDYTFDLIGTLDHADGTNPDDIIDLEFGFDAIDADGDSSSGTITVHVHDDGPFIDKLGGLAFNEDDLDAGFPVSVSKEVDYDYGADGPGDIKGNGEFHAKFKVGGPDETLTSGGVEVVVSQTAAGGYIGIAGGEKIFTLDVNPLTGEYTYTQYGAIDHPGEGLVGTDDVIWLKFGLTITDSDGDTDTVVVNIDVRDGGPVAADDTDSVDEGGQTGGDVMANDDVGVDAPGSVTEVSINGTTVAIAEGQTVTIDGQYGTLEISSNGEYTYTAFDGAEGTDVFTYTMDDFDGDTDTATLTIDVAGDSEPIVAEEEIKVDETDLGPVTINGELDIDFGGDSFGDLIANGDVEISGSVDGPVLTSNGVLVSIITTDGGYTGMAGAETIFTLTFNQDTGEYEFNLFGNLDHGDPNNPDDIITIDFGVTVFDDDGDQADGSVTVHIHDDGPVLSNQTKTLDESNLDSGPVVRNGDLSEDFGADNVGTISSNGSFNATGSVAGGTLTSGGVAVIVTQTADGYVGMAGGETIFTLTIDNAATGEYTYTQYGPIDHADGSDPNDIITLEFGVDITDGDGDSDSANIKINVKDDAPTASNDHNSFDVQNDVTSGNVLNNDDLSNDGPNLVTQVSFGNTTVNVPEDGFATINGDYGTLKLYSDGSYTYDLFEVPHTTTEHNANLNSNDVKPWSPTYINKAGIEFHAIGGDFTWSDWGAGAGLGIDSGDGIDKLYGNGEGIAIRFNDQSAEEVTLEIGDITASGNDIHDVLETKIYLSDGRIVNVNYDMDWFNPVNGVVTININADSFGDDVFIDRIDVYPGSLSTMLVDVTADIVEFTDTLDQFEYTVTDGDGDSDTAILTIEGDASGATAPVTMNSSSSEEGSGDDGSATFAAVMLAENDGAEYLGPPVDSTEPSLTTHGGGAEYLGPPLEQEVKFKTSLSASANDDSDVALSASAQDMGFVHVPETKPSLSATAQDVDISSAMSVLSEHGAATFLDGYDSLNTSFSTRADKEPLPPQTKPPVDYLGPPEIAEVTLLSAEETKPLHDPETFSKPALSAEETKPLYEPNTFSQLAEQDHKDSPVIFLDGYDTLKASFTASVLGKEALPPDTKSSVDYLGPPEVESAIVSAIEITDVLEKPSYDPVQESIDRFITSTQDNDAKFAHVGSEADGSAVYLSSAAIVTSASPQAMENLGMGMIANEEQKNAVV